MSIRRYWDEDSHTFIEVVVVFDGCGAMPHQARDAKYWQQPSSMLLEAALYSARKAANGLEAYPTVNEAKRLKFEPADDTWRNYDATEKRMHCRGCGQKFQLSKLTDKLRLCPTCRPGRQRAVRYSA